MPEYRRNYLSGGPYSFTVVTFQRRPWLCREAARTALRRAVHHVRLSHPFRVDAWVLLPDHLHCLWTLPPGDSDFSTGWRLVKGFVSRALASEANLAQSPSRVRTGEKSLWQRRFWEHTIRDARDFEAHCDYIHYNPVKHGVCRSPAEWPWSTLGRYLADGSYTAGWGEGQGPGLPQGVGRE